MNKKFLFVFIILILLFVIGIYFVYVASDAPGKTISQTPSHNSSAFLDTSSEALTPFPSFSSGGGAVSIPPQLPSQSTISEPDHLTPEDTARRLYSWYLTYPGVTALSSGAYKKNIYLSDKFKRIISMMAPFNGQYDPVFCAQNKSAKYTVLPATTTGNGRQAVIIQSVPDGRGLHKLVLDNINGRWVVDDTICIP